MKKIISGITEEEAYELLQQIKAEKSAKRTKNANRQRRAVS